MVLKIVTKSRKIIANNIVYYRVKNNWTQEKFAELLGTSVGYVSEMENVKRSISIDYLDHIANTFKIEPFELLIDRPFVKKRKIPKSKKTANNCKQFFIIISHISPYLSLIIS